MTSATGRRPSENVVWAWRLPFRSGTGCSLGATSSARSGAGYDGGLPLGSAPGDREAEAQPSGLPHVRRPILRHYPHRRAPPGEPHAAGRRFFREGLDEGGVEIDDGVAAVDVGILGTRDLAALGLGADDLELGRSRGRRLDLDARLRHGRPRGPERQRDHHRGAQHYPKHTPMLSDMAGTRKRNSKPAKDLRLAPPGSEAQSVRQRARSGPRFRARSIPRTARSSASTRAGGMRRAALSRNFAITSWGAMGIAGPPRWLSSRASSILPSLSRTLTQPGKVLG